MSKPELVQKEQQVLGKILRAIDYFLESIHVRRENVQTRGELKQLDIKEDRYRCATNDPFYGVFRSVNEQGDTEEFRIGRHGPIHDNYSDVIVVSYFSDEGAKYSFDPGPNSPIEYKAAVSIVDGVVVDVVETAEAMRQLRREKVSGDRTGELRDVIETVRQDQDLLVRIDSSKSLLVTGGPGTGKTVVGLQRLGYVLFEQQKTLLESPVLIIGPSEAYSDYVQGFLPGLGFRKVETFSPSGLFLNQIRNETSINVSNTSEQRSVVRDKNSDGVERVLLNSIWPKSRLAPLSIKIDPGRRRGNDLQTLIVDVQEIHDRLRDEFLSFQLSYDGAREQLFTELLFKILQRPNQEVDQTSARSLERRRDSMITNWSRMMRSYTRLWIEIEDFLKGKKGLQFQRDLLAVMRDYYKEDVEVAISLLNESFVARQNQSIEKIGPSELFDVRELRKILETLGVDKKAQALGRNNLGTRNLAAHELGSYKASELIGDRESPFGSQLWFYVRKSLPNRSVERVAAEVISGRSRTYQQIGVVQIAKLGERLREYDAMKTENEEIWSPSDLAILSITDFLIRGQRNNFSHVVLDEAQDLTAMQLRAIGYQIAGSSVTVLGDLNQVTAFGAVANWEKTMELLDHSNYEYGNLDVNYRVPRKIYEYACSYIEETSDTKFSKCELEGGLIKVVTTSDKQSSIESATVEISEFKDQGLIGVIGVASSMPDLKDETALKIIFASPSESKGLEVDHLIIVEPSEWYDQSAEMKKLMFVVLTRATKSVTIIQSQRASGRIRSIS
jgi:DNA helicase IV